MLGRLGFLGRLVLIVLLLLLALAALSVGLSLVPREGQQADVPRFPLPDQIAGIVELIDATAPDGRDAALRAIRTPQLLVSIDPAPPGTIPETGRMPAVEWLVTQYLETFQERLVIAVRDEPEQLGAFRRWLDRISPRSGTALSVFVELADGQFLTVEIPGATPNRLFGVPVGFWVGLFGCLFAALALWAIAREARPLRALVGTVERFGADGVARPVARRGAPEIRRLIDAVNAMQTRIATLIKGRTILIGAVSHDLKTFITRLRLRAEGLPDETSRDKAIADLDAMTQIVDDAIAIARGTGEPARRETFDLSDLLTDEINTRKEPRLDLTADTGPHTITGDRVAIRRLLANLIDNALAHGREARVTLRSDAHGPQILVDDDGPGVPEQDRSVVFDPFVRLDPSRSRETGGSGLGLAIVKQVAEAHGGAVSISKSPIGGARFKVSLPAATTTASVDVAT